ncbi:UDP-N-acetylglucosamine 1-carboxyvinyltransferase [candidate division WWE3 bacterium]|uniref:UDP-N-acetylglucosamine 1-carboxyvinyltransferase n=1 Tax=candidate division WWE3 bacterium TaxID=2053526 RepID=A0A7X9E6U1_UNCKA|nr:UDP-N-acetylglucosamine 1-carboxyvinyltransferase [candidate division WWE3 bacterium]
MPGIIVEGGTPLMGSVLVSGSKNSALKLIPAAMFSNEDIILSNVPRIKTIFDDLEVITSIGGKADWVGPNTLILNGSTINTCEVPLEIGSKYRTTMLLAGPLLFRFGKAFIPKYRSATFVHGSVNRFLDTWKALGFKIEEDEEYYKIFSENPNSASIVFRTSSHMATDNAILSSVFIQGETVITNASEECEIDDLVEMLNQMGASVERIEPRKIRINGVSIFKGTKFEVCSDKSEIATLASAAIVTKGNISIKGVRKDAMVQFVNFLDKIGMKFEFSGDELRVWRHDEDIKPLKLEISATPGFVPDWQSLATLILTQASGESTIHDTVYTDRFGYVVDLNRMGAKIEVLKPSEEGIIPVISDDSYDYDKLGEPSTLAKIKGPTKLKSERLNIDNFKYGAVLVLAALCAEGKSEIIGVENIENFFEGFVNKLKSLGAKIWEQ